MRSLALAATLFAALLPARAQQADQEYSLKDYRQRAEEAVAACTADPQGTACFIGMKSVLPTTIDALTFLGYEDTYENAAPLLREMTSFPVPEVATAAVYALARLGPRSEDLPVLRDALLSDVSMLRRAAIGALKLLPDAQAQELYARAVPNAGSMPSGYASSDRLPFVPTDAGVTTWPQDTHYLFFHNRISRGTYVFTTAADVASTISLFEQQAGTKSVGMGDVEQRFGGAYGDLLAEWKERNETLGAVQAIVLTGNAEPTDAAPAVLALVYEDYALARTGFALVRLPGLPLAAPPLPPEPAPPPPPTGDAAIWYGGGTFVPKEGATPEDSAAWQEVRSSEGEFAAAYLEKFPDGAYRAEAEAIVGAPSIETDLEIYSETDPIVVHWRNVPVAEGMVLTLGSPGDESLYDTMTNDQIPVTGPEGSATLVFSPYFEPGVYDVRIIDEYGEPVAMTQVRIALASATLTLARDAVRPGQDIQVSYKNMAGSPRDMISLAPKGAPANELGSVRVQTDGKPEGSVTLTAPDEPGEYEVRAWFNGEARLRARVMLTVKGPDQPPEITDPSQPGLAIAGAEVQANERILIRFAGFPDTKGNYIALANAGDPLSSYVTYVDIRETSGVAEMKLPPEPGAYELRAFFGGKADTAYATTPLTIKAPEGVPMAALTLDKQTYAPGETIGIDFKGMSGANTDYVAVALKGARYRSYVSYVYTKGATEGHAELKAPTDPGEYEIRAFYQDDTTVLRAAVPFRVAATP